MKVITADETKKLQSSQKPQWNVFDSIQLSILTKLIRFQASHKDEGYIHLFYTDLRPLVKEKLIENGFSFSAIGTTLYWR